MLSRQEAVENIFDKHGEDSVYVTSTGFISRMVYNMYPQKKNIFYMQGSMGLAPGIGLGVSLFTEKDVVVINGDASHLMHLGLTHTIRDYARNNLFVYILDNGCHESVGGQRCSSLEKEYVGTTEIIKISCDGKTSRVKMEFEENARNIIGLLKVN
jgi:phosphonopyruvate decarboxylase|tara:strand:+ start:29 stop:496 length:468 start_codon:yes stop_codon:yes gene_type:complete